jgi:hypothetical protein
MSVVAFDSAGRRELGLEESKRRSSDLVSQFSLLGRDIHNSMIYFGGHVGRHPQGGGYLTQNEEEGGERADWYASRQIGKRFEGSGLVVIAMDGSGRNGDHVVDEAAGWVRDSFDPRAALIIYGYSVGAFNALGLCASIERNYNWYSFRRNRLGSVPNPTDADRMEGGKVRVDRLISVDPCIVDVRPGMRTFGPAAGLVRRHANYYEEVEPRYKGLSAPSAAPNDLIRHSEVAGVTLNHGNMPRIVLEKVCLEIGTCLQELR